MIYLNLGEAIKRGMVLYRDIYANKPPLLYIVAGVAGNLFWFRAILALWMMGTTVAFWKLAQALFLKERKIVIVATSVFAVFTTIPLLEGQVANIELFMIGPIILAFWILLSQKLKPGVLFEAGVFFSVAALFKVPSMFDMATIVFLWIIALKWKSDNFRGFIKHTFFLLLGFSVPFILTIIWYWLRGALNEYITGAFMQNLAYGPLLLRSLIVLAGLGLLYFYRKKLSLPFVFACSWLLVSLFAATLSENPSPHYLIQIIPSMSLLVGILVAKQSLEQSLAVIPLFLMLLAIQKYQFAHYPTFSYYTRFVNYMTGSLRKDQYYNAFDGSVLRNYKIAEFILTSTTLKDPVFVWGDSPVVYTLSDKLPPIKYVATDHIQDFSSQEETVQALNASKPKLIVILPDSPEFPLLSKTVEEDYILIRTIENAEVYLRLNNTNK